MRNSRKPVARKKNKATKIRKVPSRARRQKKTVMVSDSYREALLRNIVNGEKTEMVNGTALLLAEVLSGFTPKMRTIAHADGIACGKILFDIIGRKEGYDQCGEYMAPFADFLETAGHKDVTYQVLPHRIIVRMKPPDNSTIRKKTHYFEAGMLCGFLNAASHKFARVYERQCANEGNRECIISYEPSIGMKENDHTDMWEGMKILARKDSEQENTKPVRGDYYALVMDSVVGKKYTKGINALMERFGKENATNTVRTGKGAGGTAERIARRLETLGFGKAHIKRETRHICLRFNGSLFRREAMEMAEAFARGMEEDRINTHIERTRKGMELHLDYVRKRKDSRTNRK